MTGELYLYRQSRVLFIEDKDVSVSTFTFIKESPLKTYVSTTYVDCSRVTKDFVLNICFIAIIIIIFGTVTRNLKLEEGTLDSLVWYHLLLPPVLLMIVTLALLLVEETSLISPAYCPTRE